MAGAGALFACTKCHARHQFEDLSKDDQLCKSCRRKYPLVPCTYCRLEFHSLKKVKGEPTCAKCSHYLSQYGKPKNCKYCQLKAAFEKSCCARCVSSEKKYGPPVKCSRCKLQCAFNKSKEAQAKVEGQILCLQCTLEFKRIQRKQRKEKQSVDDRNPPVKDDWHAGIKSHTTSQPVIAPLKAENLATKFKSSMDTIKPRSKENSRAGSPFLSLSTHDRNANETSHDLSSYGDHMSELTKLRDEIAVLKKSLAAKEKTILDKDKKITELQAELWERDKLLKSKVSGIQKEYKDKIEELQRENGTLKKQIVTFKKNAKSRKSDRVYSRIRLEPHKLASLSAQSSPSTSYMQENKSDSEVIDFKSSADEHADEDDNIKNKEEKKEASPEPKSDAPDSSVPASPEPVEEKVKEEPKVEKSFDEAQEAEIQKIMGPADSEENTEENTEKEEEEIKSDKSKKKKKRKHKLNLLNEDNYTSSGTDMKDDDDDDEDVVRKKKRKRRSKLIEDDDMDDIESPIVSAPENEESKKENESEELEELKTEVKEEENLKNNDNSEDGDANKLNDDENIKESDSDESEVNEGIEEDKVAQSPIEGDMDEILQGTDNDGDDFDEDEVLDSQSD